MKEETKKKPVRCMSFAIVKPVDVSWDDAGLALRTVHSACICAANLTMAQLLRADTDLFEAPFPDNGQIAVPKNGEKKIVLPKPDKDVLAALYRNVTARYPQVSRRILNYVTRDVSTRYRQSRWQIATGQKRSSTYRSYPIPQDQYRIFEQDDGSFCIEISLLSNGTKLSRIRKDQPTEIVDCPQRVRFVLHTSKSPEWHKEMLSKMARTQEYSCLKIRHNKRKKKWECLIPAEMPTEEQTLYPERTLEVFPPGKGEILRATFFAKAAGVRGLDARSAVWSVPVEFASAQGLQAAYQRRSRAISGKYRQDTDSGARGHGRNRALQNKTKWQDKYRRVCHTLNQQRAAFVVKMAKRWKCGRIIFINPADSIDPRNYNLLPDWAWGEFSNCIANAAERAGIEYVQEETKLDEFMSKIEALWSSQERKDEDQTEAA
jgi:hypothetical protein